MSNAETWFEAVSKGDLGLLQHLHNNKVKGLNDGDEDGWTPLIHAVYDGILPVVNFLLQVGADVDKQDSEGATALSWAAYRGKVNVFESILKKKPNLKLLDSDGNTPLFGAVNGGRADIVKALLKAGVDPYNENKFGESIFDRGTTNAVKKVLAPIKKKYEAKKKVGKFARLLRESFSIEELQDELEKKVNNLKVDYRNMGYSDYSIHIMKSPVIVSDGVTLGISFEYGFGTEKEAVVFQKDFIGYIKKKTGYTIESTIKEIFTREHKYGLLIYDSVDLDKIMKVGKFAKLLR